MAMCCLNAAAQTIHMLGSVAALIISSSREAMAAIVPLANGYFQSMKTSQCQAQSLGHKCAYTSFRITPTEQYLTKYKEWSRPASTL